MFWEVAGTLGTLSTIVLALVGAAYWMFQTFSERWLQSKFDSRLQALKHDQSVEIERLRFQINAMMDRASKMHDHEYRALPELWTALLTAWWEVGAFTSRLQSYPDVRRMTPEELEEHLAKTELAETQKTTIRTSQNRHLAYRNEIYPLRKSKAVIALQSFTQIRRKFSIFYTAELDKALGTLVHLLMEALSEHEANHEHGVMPRVFEAQDRLIKDGSVCLDAIQDLIRDRMGLKANLDS